MTEKKKRRALEYCSKHLGDNATIHCPPYLPSQIDQEKKAGGASESYFAVDFYGSKADKVVAISS